MEDFKYGSWVFSDETTRKKAEELARLFMLQEADDRDNNIDKELALLFQPRTNFQRSDTETSESVLQDSSSGNNQESHKDFSCSKNDAWINIDNVIFSEPEKIEATSEIQDRPIQGTSCRNFEEDPQMEISDESHFKEQDPMIKTEEMQISVVLGTFEISEKESVEVPQEFIKQFASQSEQHLVTLLGMVSESASEQILTKLVNTVSGNMGARDQSVVASLLCSHALLPRFQREPESASQLLEAVCDLAKVLPHLVSTLVLLPALGDDITLETCVATTALKILRMSANIELKHLLLREWLNSNSSRLHSISEPELGLLQILLEGAIRDADTLCKIGAMFEQMSPSLATNVTFSKLLLSTTKTFAQLGQVPDKCRTSIANAVATNKTALKKMLQKALSAF